MIISSQQRFLLSLVVLSLLWLLMVTVQLSRVERIYHSNPSAPSAASIGGAPAVEDDALPEWAELMLPSESERKQFQRYAAARHGSVALVQALQKHGGGSDPNASSESSQSLPEPVDSEYSVIPGSLSEDGGSTSTDYSFIPSSLDESMTTATSSSSPRHRESPSALTLAGHLPARPAVPSTSPALPVAPKRKQASFHGVGSPAFAAVPRGAALDHRAQSSRSARSPVNSTRSTPSPPLIAAHDGAAATRSTGNLLAGAPPADWRSQSARTHSVRTPPGSPSGGGGGAQLPPMVAPRKNSRPDAAALPPKSPRHLGASPPPPPAIGGLTLPSLPPAPIAPSAVVAPTPQRSTPAVAASSPTAPRRAAPSPSTPQQRVAPTPQRLPPPSAPVVGASPSSPSQQHAPPQQQQSRAAPSPVTAPRRVSVGNEAFHSGTPPFDLPPGDGSHENADSSAAFKAMLVTTLSDKTWYRKDLPRAQAEAMLVGKPVGAFVVRDSSVPHCLALTHVDVSGATMHVVLEHWDCKERRGWSREGGHTTHSTVEALLRQLTIVTFD